MDGLKPASRTARLIADALSAEGLTLIDIGCNGGLDRAWEAFGDNLTAFGFDPAILEVERLRRQETRPRVRYVAGYVGLPIDHPLRAVSRSTGYTDKNPWERTSAAAGIALGEGSAPPRIDGIRDWAPSRESLNVDERVAAYEASAQTEPVREKRINTAGRDLDEVSDQTIENEAQLMRQNLWNKATLASPYEPIVPLQYLQSEGIEDVDFIKLDVDGADYEILHALDSVFESAHVLGVSAEVNFFGSDARHQNTFHAVDRFMRAQGFDLFDLSIRRYTSSALPGRFLNAFPSQTLRGRPVQGDALYLRDFGWRQPRANPDDYSAVKLVRLAALFCLFDLPDQAAELAIRFREKISAIIDVDELLDCLALEIQEGEHLRYRYQDYINLFSKGHPYFFNQQHEPRYEGPIEDAHCMWTNVAKPEAARSPATHTRRISSTAQPKECLTPTSLGQTLEARYQIVRNQFSRFYPNEPPNVVRWTVFNPEHSSFFFETGVFDRQITPPSAVCEYLERDFKGVFELEDLVATGDSLQVYNSRFQTSHPGLFEAAGDILTREEILTSYTSAREIFERLAAYSRAMLAEPAQRLYVLTEAPNAETVERLVSILRERARHSFRLLIRATTPDEAAAIARIPEVDVHLARNAHLKPPEQQWEGDDEDWDAAFSKYTLANGLVPPWEMSG